MKRRERHAHGSGVANHGDESNGFGLGERVAHNMPSGEVLTAFRVVGSALSSYRPVGRSVARASSITNMRSANDRNVTRQKVHRSGVPQ